MALRSSIPQFCMFVRWVHDAASRQHLSRARRWTPAKNTTTRVIRGGNAQFAPRQPERNVMMGIPTKGPDSQVA